MSLKTKAIEIENISETTPLDARCDSTEEEKNRPTYSRGSSRVFFEKLI